MSSPKVIVKIYVVKMMWPYSLQIHQHLANYRKQANQKQKDHEQMSCTVGIQ